MDKKDSQQFYNGRTRNQITNYPSSIAISTDRIPFTDDFAYNENTSLCYKNEDTFIIGQNSGFFKVVIDNKPDYHTHLQTFSKKRTKSVKRKIPL